MGKDNGGDLAYLRCGNQGGLLGGGLTFRLRLEAGVEVRGDSWCGRAFWAVGTEEEG